MRRACLHRGCPESVESPAVRCVPHELTYQDKRAADGQHRSGRNQVRRDQQLRRQVLYTYGYRCVRCGSGQNLDVHHVNGNARDNRPFNLAPLCHDCHIKAEAELRELNRQAIAARRAS